MADSAAGDLTLRLLLRWWWRRLSFRARLLFITLGLFFALVSLRLHGSSIALAARVWAPADAMEQFVASPLLKLMKPKARARWRRALMAEERYVRMDEWANEGTLYSLAQFTHDPAFPVVNTNVGNGQNMLLLPWAPVAHVSAIARPMTWGYLLLGPERGLAWAWWSQVFGCFIALYLLFELIVPHRPWLAVLGAGWFCGSAYVVCWSLWPAYVVGLGAGSVVSAYWLLRSTRPVVVLGCGLAFALTFAGFVMQLYPPWQVPLGETFVLIFAASCWRDRIWRKWRGHAWLRCAGIVLALVLSGLLLGAFVASSADALRAMSETVYPGKRRLLGGDAPAWQLFGGFFNYFTKNYFIPRTDPSEAAGFFLFIPGVLVAAVASRRIRAALGPFFWMLLPMAALLFYYSVTQVPAWLASATMLSHAQAFRTQIALGLISIVVCVRLLAVAGNFPRDRQRRLTALAVFLVCTALYVWQAVEWQAEMQLFKPSRLGFVLAVPVAAALLSAMLVLGRARAFAACLAVALLLTCYDFNPLSVGFPDFRSSELGLAIQHVNQRDKDARGGKSLWLTYGGLRYPNGGTIAQLMGVRALAGVYYYPQMSVWGVLDPQRKQESKYNRFTVARLGLPDLSSKQAVFDLLTTTVLTVDVSPLHPGLRKLGARYVLTFGEQPELAAAKFKQLYRSEAQDFTIWEIPRPKRKGRQRAARSRR